MKQGTSKMLLYPVLQMLLVVPLDMSDYIPLPLKQIKLKLGNLFSFLEGKMQQVLIMSQKDGHLNLDSAFHQPPFTKMLP